MLLHEFVHLMFADKRLDWATGGTSGDYGAYVFVERKWDHSQAEGYDFHAGLSRTAAHEITHTLLDTAGNYGFDFNEHLDDPDPSDGPNGPLDQKYLMYKLVPENRTTITFSNPTRTQLDLTSKESVER